MIADRHREIHEIQLELDQERRAFRMSERAPMDGRVCDYGRWESAQKRRAARIAELEAWLARLHGQEEAA